MVRDTPKQKSQGISETARILLSRADSEGKPRDLMTKIKRRESVMHAVVWLVIVSSISYAGQLGASAIYS
jgi:hypothetical protein